MTSTPTDQTPIPAPATPTPRRITPLLSQLDREWARLRRRPATLRTVRRWTGDPAFTMLVTSARSLDEIVAATQPGADAPGAEDGKLRRLIEISATDELAGRIVLQRLLPGLISRSRAWAGRSTATGHPSDIAIGAAWIAIRRFDVDARRRHIAPSLIADALWIGFRREARRRQATEVPVARDVLCSQLSVPQVADPITALAGTIRAAARAGVHSSDLDAIRAIAAAGGPTRAARAQSVTVRTIRNRRNAAASRIRSALGPDWADWSDPLVAA
jgi:hypothetical protein